MADQIVDGTGSGYRVKVNPENRMLVEAACVDITHQVNHEHEQCFSSIVQQTPAGANNAFLYIKNAGTDDMNIWNAILRAASAETIELWSVSGTAVGTEHIPVNMTVGSGIAANVTAVEGTNITGLTKLKLLRRIHVEAAKESLKHHVDAALIVQSSHAIALYAVSGSILVDTTLVYDFHNAWV